jgi:hypothetical protein
MKKVVVITYILISSILTQAQSPLTPFEKSAGKQTSTYFEAIDYYQKLSKKFSTISIKTFGNTDAGYPLHLVLFSPDKTFDAAKWHEKEKVIILINNGIHPGEPDGVDACMILLRDLATNKIKAAPNVVIAIIPLYNIGGAFNRNSFSRVNQDGPESYGFRGNAQNLDLNRDFTKNDSKNARAFASIFHYLNPHILIDNHVSDGADYQYTMTMLTSQHNKLGGNVASYLKQIFEPSLYKSMATKDWPMCPYVNVEHNTPDKGWNAFSDPPRFSSGYAALFQTIGFVPETHMLKPFDKRVHATYALMQSFIEECGKQAKSIVANKKKDQQVLLSQTTFPLNWTVDSSRFDTLNFKGYEAATKTSAVTGLPRLYYDRSKPFEKDVRFYNYFKPTLSVVAPKAYIIPQGWHAVIELLQLNKVQARRLTADTTISVETYRIEDYKTSPAPYEKHYKHTDITTSKSIQDIRFLKGDFVIELNQPAKRYIVEMLEPMGDDSFFAWNFFDAILQQKEYYSDYRWEDVAAEYIKQHPSLKQQLEEKKKADPKFAESSSAQLNFIYKNSPYYEPAHLRYPVYRVHQ